MFEGALASPCSIEDQPLVIVWSKLINCMHVNRDFTYTSWILLKMTSVRNFIVYVANLKEAPVICDFLALGCDVIVICCPFYMPAVLITFFCWDLFYMFVSFSGSGKTYLAKMLRDLEVENGGDAPRIHSMDDYFMTEVEKVVEYMALYFWPAFLSCHIWDFNWLCCNFWWMLC